MITRATLEQRLHQLDALARQNQERTVQISPRLFTIINESDDKDTNAASDFELLNGNMKSWETSAPRSLPSKTKSCAS